MAFLWLHKIGLYILNQFKLISWVASWILGTNKSPRLFYLFCYMSCKFSRRKPTARYFLLIPNFHFSVHKPNQPKSLQASATAIKVQRCACSSRNVYSFSFGTVWERKSRIRVTQNKAVIGGMLRGGSGSVYWASRPKSTLGSQHLMASLHSNSLAAIAACKTWSWAINPTVPGRR